jgi:glycosyltransferase involved in cell wall biosynthesis
MKILHLNDHLSWSGGIETYLLSLIPELEAIGHSQVVGYAEGDGSLLSSATQLPFLAQSGRKARRDGRRQTMAILADVQPDVVHVHNIHNTGVLEACLKAVPTILHGHDYRYLCPASSFYFRGHEAICERTCGPLCFAATVRGRCMSLRPPYAWSYYHRVRFVAKHARSFAVAIANSRYMGDRFEQAGFRADQVSVLPYFCPLEPLDRIRPLPSRPTILFIGRARANKGFRYFVEALGRLPADVQGIMVGDFSSESTAAVRQLASEWNCSDRLELRPWASRENIHDVYRAATVLVVPSIWAEPLGIVGLESLACGVPVVGSDVGGVREWLIDGKTGRLVPPKDSAAIARAVVAILNSPDQGLSLGQHGCDLIRSKFSTTGHVDGLLQLYESAMANSRDSTPAAV